MRFRSPVALLHHRAIDWAPQMEEALEQVIEAGAEFALYAVAAEDVRALRDALETVQDGDLARTSPRR